jgi:predicted nucleic acid-binding protein
MPERCVDASVAIKWVLKSEMWRKNARRFLRDSAKANFTLIAPPLYEYETESVLQRQVYSGLLTIVEADAALKQLAVIGVQIVTHPNMVKRAREIARQFSQPRIYDSLYAALSELRDCEFWTADKAFYSAVMKALPFVKYLPDYE